MVPIPGGPGVATVAAVAAPPVAQAQAACSECGSVFNAQDMIVYGNVHVCARCKPLFLQRLAEGGQLQKNALRYAGVWTRFGAVFLDGLILWVVNTAINLIAGVGIAGSQPFQPGPGGAQQFNPAAMGLFIVLFFVQISIAVSYETIMIGRFGATLGKMACSIRVVTADGGRVSYLRAFGRYFAKIVSGMPCLIGYIMAFFDEEKRSLHDRICNTRVVLK
jgi:uncharacterized RDD family membrane protein YckC